MTVCFTGFGEQTATFEASGDLTLGAPVAIASNGTVAAAKKGDDICGVVTSVFDGYAAVQTAGYVKLSYSGETAPSHGYCALSADGDGGVAAAAAGRKLLVVEVEEDLGQVGLIL